MKYFLIIISAVVVLSCKDKGNYSKVNSSQSTSKMATHEIVIMKVEC